MPPGDKKKITNQQVSSDISRRLSNTRTAFTKSKTKKYPYLGSQFQFDTNVFNPMKSQGPTQRSYKYSTSDGTGTSRVGSQTHYNEAKYKQDQSLKTYFGGNPKQRKSAEKGAKRAANISSNLFTFIFIIWILYGFAAMLSTIPKNISYNILDIIAKNFYGLFIVYKIIEINKSYKK